MLLVFLAVSFGIAAGYQALSGFLFAHRTRVSRRIAEEFGKEKQAVQSLLFKNVDELSLEPRLDLLDPERPAETLAPPAPRGLHGRLETLLEGANVGLTPPQVFWIAVSVGLCAGLAGFFGAGLWLAIPAAALGSAAPIYGLYCKQQTRRDSYLKQLPAAFELMARVTRAGQSVPQAFQAVADAMEEPLASEFASCQKHQNLGLRPEFAFQELAVRSGILEMRIFSMAMLIQRQTGGNLADVLERLAGLVRARLRLRERVRILTAEGRLQGWTLVVLPFLAFGVMMFVNRQYAEVLLDHVPLLVGMVVLMGLGMLWIRKIVHFEC